MLLLMALVAVRPNGSAMKHDVSELLDRLAALIDVLISLQTSQIIKARDSSEQLSEIAFAYARRGRPRRPSNGLLRKYSTPYGARLRIASS